MNALIERMREAGAQWFHEHPDGASTDDDWRGFYRALLAVLSADLASPERVRAATEAIAGQRGALKASGLEPSSKDLAEIALLAAGPAVVVQGSEERLSEQERVDCIELTLAPVFERWGCGADAQQVAVSVAADLRQLERGASVSPSPSSPPEQKLGRTQREEDAAWGADTEIDRAPPMADTAPRYAAEAVLRRALLSDTEGEGG